MDMVEWVKLVIFIDKTWWMREFRVLCVIEG